MSYSISLNPMLFKNIALLGPFTFTFTLESEEYEKFEVEVEVEVGCAALPDLH